MHSASFLQGFRRRLIARLLASSLIASLFSGSVIAAPDAPRYLAVSAQALVRETSFDAPEVPASMGDALSLVAGAVFGLFVPGGSKSKKKSSFKRIEVRAGAIEVIEGEAVSFMAVAYSGETIVGGIPFEWWIADASNGIERRLPTGRFETRRPGRYIVKARAGGIEGAAEVNVRADSRRAQTRTLRKIERDLTEGERAQIARWRTSGALTTRTVDSRISD